MSKRCQLWVLCDGKPGHENQSLGLAEAIARLSPAEIHCIPLERQGGIFHRLKSAHVLAGKLPKPRLIIAAGHRTHPALLTLSRRYQAPAIVVMKPSLPFGLFDLCIAPSHDFPLGSPRKNLILTRGAMNRVPPSVASRRKGRLILIGGPSQNHDWDGAGLTSQIEEIAGNGDWVIADSRRTPEDFLLGLAPRVRGCRLVPHGETTAGWLPHELSRAEEVWVTEDSVSMVYEALSSGANVGLLTLPKKRAGSRVLAGLEQLTDDGFITSFSRWQRTHEMGTPPEILREADRVAELVAARWL